MSQDFKDMLLAFNAHEVQFMVVGAYAVTAYTSPRYTGDIDYWVNPTPTNAKRVLQALIEFGAPIKDLTLEDLSKKGTIYQIGVQPVRIDVITKISGVEFEEAWEEKKQHLLFEVPIYIPSKKHLIQNKKASGRPKDLLDVDELLKTE